MIGIIRNDIWLCVECMIVAVNGDTSGIEDEKRVARITAGLDALGPHLVPTFDTETDEGHEEFAANYPDVALLFAWNHRDEIMAKEKFPGQWLNYVPAVSLS